MNGRIARKLRKKAGGVETRRSYHRESLGEKNFKNPDGVGKEGVTIPLGMVICISPGRNKYKDLKQQYYKEQRNGRTARVN